MKNSDFFDEQKPGRPYVPSAAWLEFDATTVALLVMLCGFGLGFSHLGKRAFDALTAWSPRVHAAQSDLPNKGTVLVVGTNLKSQTAILLTASPRGYQSIFVNSGDQAISRLQGENNSIKVAVVDQRAPGATQALETIRRLLPLRHVIALHGPIPSADVAQLLLDVL